MARFEVYVDGSYNKNKRESIGAFVILDYDNPIMICRLSTTDKIFVSQESVGGELLAASAGIVNTINCLKDARANKTCDDTHIVVYHDSIAIRNFIVPPKSNKQPWRAHNDSGAGAYYQRIVAVVLEENYPIKIQFQKVSAHSGVKWNEFADKIAGGYIKSYNGLELLELTV